MGLDRNFLVVCSDLDGDETYDMDPVIVNGRQPERHGINHKLHPDLTRLNNSYTICQKPSGLSTCPDLRPRAISGEIDMSIVKQWLEDCQTSHGSCPNELKLDEHPPGIRLIDCQNRVVIIAEDIDEVDRPLYVALSYVWGSAFHPPMQPDARLPSGIPQVIEDAVKVTLATGYRYL